MSGKKDHGMVSISGDFIQSLTMKSLSHTSEALNGGRFISIFASIGVFTEWLSVFPWIPDERLAWCK